jgi:hypothetical protein
MFFSEVTMTTAISVAPQAVALSPGQLGQRWGTSVAKVLALIHAGELHAINIADDPDGVPRFKVLPSEIERFEMERSSMRRPRKPRQPAA